MLRLLVILAIVALLIQVNDAKPLDQAILALGVAAILAFVWSRLSVRSLAIQRRLLTEHPQVGESFSEQLMLINESWIPKLWLEIVDYSSLPGHVAGRVARVSGRSTVEWVASSFCRQRGEFHLGPLRVRSGDPFGIFSRTVIAPSTLPVLVWPLSVVLPAFHEPRGLHSGGRQSGWSPFTTPSVAGIRDYAPGDPFNRIAWSATARTGHLMSKEFEQDPVTDIWVLLDFDHRVQQMARPEAIRDPALFSTEEYGVAIAASICRTFLERGRAVGCVITGRPATVLAPERGVAQTARIFDHLAVAVANGAEPLDSALLAHQGRFAPQTSLVVVSSSVDERWSEQAAHLAASGVAVQAVIIRAETFDDAAHSGAVTNSLIVAGIPVTAIACGEPLQSLSNLESHEGGFRAVG